MKLLPISTDIARKHYYKPFMSSDPYSMTADKEILYDLPEPKEKLADHAISFASVLMHEVRNPLTTINLSVEMLGSAMKNSDLQIYLDIILRSSMRIHTLIAQLLASQEADNVKLEKHSIVQLLDRVLETLADRIGLDQVLVQKDYTVEECDLLLNRPKMEIALTNIIINAIDAMIDGKRELRLVTRSMESEYILWIEDSGCGINKENLQLIFQPYYTKKAGGLGLGLAVAYDILRSNDVRIGVESEEGAGTRFILHFNRNRGYA